MRLRASGSRAEAVTGNTFQHHGQHHRKKTLDSQLFSADQIVKYVQVGRAALV